MIVFVLVVSIVTLVFEDQAKPHTNAFLSAFCYCMSWQVLLCILMLLLLDAEMTSNTVAMVISVALLITNIGLVAIVLKDTDSKKKRSKRWNSSGGMRGLRRTDGFEKTGRDRRGTPRQKHKRDCSKRKTALRLFEQNRSASHSQPRSQLASCLAKPGRNSSRVLRQSRPDSSRGCAAVLVPPSCRQHQHQRQRRGRSRLLPGTK